MHKNTQQLLDEILDLDSLDKIKARLQKTKEQNQSLFSNLSAELKQSLIIEPETKITCLKLYVLQNLCQLDATINSLYFKTETVYQLVSVCLGYMKGGSEIRGYLARNLKKNSTFWGVNSIQGIYSSIINKTTPTISKSIDIKSKVYLWTFIISNIQIFPTSLDVYQYAIKHMLMLRVDRKQQTELFNSILDLFLKYPYSYQCLSKNFRFIVQFFRSATPLPDKQIAYNPQLSAFHIIKNFTNYQIDNMFAIGTLGLSYSETDILNCINNVIKLGIDQQRYRLLKAFIELFKNMKKYHELVQAFEKNIAKVFIFLKFPQLYPPSLKILKQFIIGPYNSTNLYNIFVQKVVEFSKIKNLKQDNFKDFRLFLVCVLEKYKQSILVTDLDNCLTSIKNCSQGENQFTPEQIRKATLQYDWRIFQNSNPKSQKQIKQGADNKQSSGEIRGIVNIGNSCYMNSFLQCLFMTKEYRKKVLEVSTLNVEKQVLTKLQNIHQGNKQGKNLALIARQTVRPLAELQRTFSLLSKSKRQSINPTNIRNISPIQFRNTNQHDSIEFGRFLIDTISRSIEHVFQGQMTTQIECPFCSSRRSKKQQFLDLMLSSSNQDTQTIQSMIKTSLEDQYIENLTCENCNNNPKNNKEEQKVIVQNSNETPNSNYQNQISSKNTPNQNINIINSKQQEDSRMYDENLHQESEPMLNQKILSEKQLQNLNAQQSSSHAQRQTDQNQKQNIQQMKQQKFSKQPKIKPNNSIKRHYVSKPPKYLILTIKRFEYNIKQNKNVKKQFKLQFSQFFLLQDTEYFIYCFIVHRGSSANSGHYFTFSRVSYQENNKQWVCLNDTTVNRLADFGKVIQFLNVNQQDTPYIIFGIQKNYWIENQKNLQKFQPLRQPLQNFVQKDDTQYIKSLGKSGNSGQIDFSMLKFATGNFFKKDQDDNGFGGGGIGGGFNNPIM